MLSIKYNSPIPIYEQLISEIERMLSVNELNPGDELPSIRSLAKQLEIANNTVARAYLELERKGVVISNGRKGTFIRESYDDSGKKVNQKIFKEGILHLLKRGLNESDIKKIFDQNITEIFK